MNETANNEVKGSESSFTHVILLLQSDLIEQRERLNRALYYTTANEKQRATIDKAISNLKSWIAEIEKAIEVLNQTQHLTAEIERLNQERQWIPCSERFPKLDFSDDVYPSVMCLIYNGSVMTAYWEVDVVGHPPLWKNISDKQVFEVTHWMSLPTNPQTK